jgi:excisionase family DNA binding protein
MDEQREDIRIENKQRGTAAGVVPLLLTIPQAAAALAVGRTTVYELISEGDLEAVHIGRSVRVPVDALRAFVDQQRVSQ